MPMTRPSISSACSQLKRKAPEPPLLIPCPQAKSRNQRTSHEILNGTLDRMCHSSPTLSYALEVSRAYVYATEMHATANNMCALNIAGTRPLLTLFEAEGSAPLENPRPPKTRAGHPCSTHCARTTASKDSGHQGVQGRSCYKCEQQDRPPKRPSWCSRPLILS
eukprot:COSAG02_NODE_2365_length_9052_cov_11.510779_6_plen_164_part_00